MQTILIPLTKTPAAISGDAVKVSGEAVQIYGKYNLSGDWRPVAVDASGEIRVEAVAEVSGQTVIISGQAVTVSGNVVKVSGEQIRIVGYYRESGDWRFVAVDASGEIAVHATVADIVTAKVSGETVKISGEVVKISGEFVSITSGQTIQLPITQPIKISGQAVIVGRNLPTPGVSGSPTVVSGGVGWLLTDADGRITARISGDTVKISGEVVKISGETVKVSGETIIAKISGEKVFPITLSGDYVSVSGLVIAKVSGEAVRVSGEAITAGRNLPTPGLSGAPVVVSGGVGWLLIDADGRVTARISGDVVKVSGEVVKVSGEVVKISGEIIIAKISGEKVFPITLSGDYIGISGLVLTSVSGNIITGKVSGEAVKVSGETIIAKVSGETIIAKTSGEVVKISGEAIKLYGYNQQSGDWRALAVDISGFVNISGQTVKVSGEAMVSIAPSLLRHGFTTIGSISGGNQLSSGVVVTVKVKNISGNAVMYIGGGAVVNSGVGFMLEAGETDTMDINNLNAIYLYAVTSGQRINWRAEAI